MAPSNGPRRTLYVNWFERLVPSIALALMALFFLVALPGSSDHPGLTAFAAVALVGITVALVRWLTAMVVLRDDASVLIRGNLSTLRVPDGTGCSAHVVDRVVGVVPRAGLVVTMADGTVRDMARWGIYAPRRGSRRRRLEQVADLINAHASPSSPTP